MVTTSLAYSNGSTPKTQILSSARTFELYAHLRVSKFVQLKASFMEMGKAYLVTELLGIDLYHLRQEKLKHFREDQLRSIAYQIVSSVKCATPS
jgi:hypothetical protein